MGEKEFKEFVERGEWFTRVLEIIGDARIPEELQDKLYEILNGVERMPAVSAADVEAAALQKAMEQEIKTLLFKIDEKKREVRALTEDVGGLKKEKQIYRKMLASVFQ